MWRHESRLEPHKRRLDGRKHNPYMRHDYRDEWQSCSRCSRLRLAGYFNSDEHERDFGYFDCGDEGGRKHRRLHGSWDRNL
jgi:hypothetical protein